MVAEILPFWTKYWYYVLLGVVTYVIFNIFYKHSQNSELQRNRQNRDALEVSENQNEEIDQDLSEANYEESALPKDLKHVPYEFSRLSETELIRRAREFYNITAARRTIRFFSPDPVPKEIIHEIIKAAGTAPSGAHTEPWTFVVISNRLMKSQIREIVEQEEEINYKKRMGIKWTTDLLPLRTNWIKEYLTTAPYLILVFKQTYGLLPNQTKKVHYYHEMSVSIACGILITAIQYAGLVTLTSTPLNCGPAIRKLLGRPPNEKLVLLLPVGFPAEDATIPALVRKPLNEILIEIH
ncbi:hypothetical protein KM043_015720 [Ampulex compressa]|nr:hypothetical protein KM043_015720 [Ampulex compressa]